MPELPEVETIRRRLHPELVGRTIRDLRVLDPTVSLQSESELRRALVGRAVVGRAVDRITSDTDIIATASG